MKVVFDHSSNESADITTFYFVPERPVPYTAGQYVEWTLPHASPDKLGIKRKFTLSSSPTESLISLTTKFSPDQSSSFKQALRQLTKGDELVISDPMGDFVLPKLVQTPLVFAAGGIGVSPYRSILKWLADTREQRPIKMIYGVEDEDEIIFQDVFDKAGQHVSLVVNKPSEAWGGERGPLTAELILGIEKPSDDTLVYVSGPEHMVEKLSKDLEQTGLHKNQIVTDAFLGYREV